MKYALKRQLSLSISGIFGAAVLLLAFQNCSQVALNDLDAEAKAAEAERIAIGKDSESVTAGISPVPDLTQIYVVDNSGTMVANQLNLAQSFGAMFDNSADSLLKFGSSVYLINTAQRSPQFSNLADLDAISGRQSLYLPNWQIDPTQFTSSYRTANTKDATGAITSYGINSGHIPGDNIGYYLKKSTAAVAPTTELKYDFMPGYVRGAALVDGKVKLYDHIEKAPLASSQYLEEEFGRRLEVMNAFRIPSSAGHSEFEYIVDTESGLCAMARVLRNQDPQDPNSSIKANNLVSMVVVSDEDDNNADGSNCVQSYTRTTNSTPYVNGNCQKPYTDIKWSTSTPRPDLCNYNVRKAYNIRWTSPSPRQGTNFEYMALSRPQSYDKHIYDVTFDKTTYTSQKRIYDVTYQQTSYSSQKRIYDVTYEQNTFYYQKRQSRANYKVFLGSPKISDGIVTNIDEWSTTVSARQSGWADGYYATGTDACKNFAITFQKPVVRTPPTVNSGEKVDVASAISCDNQWVNTASCTEAPDTCRKVYNQTTKTGIYGVYSVGAAQAYAASQPDYRSYISSVDRGLAAAASCSDADLAALMCQRNYNQTTLRADGVYSVGAAQAYAALQPDYRSYISSIDRGLTSTTACSDADLAANKCVRVFDQATIRVDGAYSVAAAQAAAALQPGFRTYLSSIDRGWTSAPDCAAPDLAAGNCRTNPEVTAWKAVSIDDQNFYSAQTCFNEANDPAKYPDTRVNNNPANVRNCLKKPYADLTFDPPALAFDNALDGGVIQAVNASVESCNGAPALRTASFNAAKLMPGSASLTTADRCSIVSHVTQTSGNIAYDSGIGDCATQVSSSCASIYPAQPSYRCTFTTRQAQTPLVSAATAIRTEERVRCDTLCSNSLQNICQGEHPTMTIAQHLQAKFGSAGVTVNCDHATTGLLTDAQIALTGILDSTRATACSAYNLPGQPIREFAPSGGVYTKPAQDIIEYVSGTKVDATGQTVPVNLVDYIRQRSQELTGGQIIFTALVRKTGDPLGQNGSIGTAYKQLIDATGGQLESVLTPDYSVVLRNLSTIIKNNLEKTFLLKKMKPTQIITRVSIIRKNTTDEVVLNNSDWVQAGATLRIQNIEFVEGDQFKIEFQNYIKN